MGRIHVRGPCVMRLLAQQELTDEVLDADGWLRSSDLGRFDEHGNLVLAGRVGDVHRGGYNVYPLEVEHVLAEHPHVRQAAVIGVPAPVIGEIGIAFVVPLDAVTRRRKTSCGRGAGPASPTTRRPTAW